MFKLSDKDDRDLGTISRCWEAEGGGLGGRFSPGDDYWEVEPLFEAYNDMMTSGDGSKSNEIYQQLVDIEPKLISIEGGAVSSFHVAIVSPTPKGLLLTLVGDRDDRADA